MQKKNGDQRFSVPKSGRQLTFLLMLGLLSVGFTAGLSGCFSGSSDEVETTDTIAQPLEGPSRLENKQTNVKITVPEDWIKADTSLRNSADIYARYPAQELYASVLSESSEVLDLFSLEDNATKYRWLIESEMSAYDGATKTSLSAIQGKPAIQYEMKGQVDGVPVVYLHTTIEGDGRYYQVVGWTTAERYDENKQTLQNIISSFEGT
ncbi:MAG: hypothetical protein AAFN12_09805 [Cyanobacteria bacterium J06560_2]